MAESVRQGKASGIHYGVDDCPPWYMTIIFGFQHYLLLFGGSLAIPLIVTPRMCIGDDDIGKSEVVSTVFFVDGLSTLLQTTLGTRLPIVQGVSFSFVSPILAILSLDKWKCPTETPDFGNATHLEQAWRRDLWTTRLREIQGSLAIASLLQIVVGSTGIIGFMLRFIGPLSIAPTITLIGLSLYVSAARYASKHWGIAFLTIALVVLFSQFLKKYQIPLPTYSKGKGCKTVHFPIFELLPVILAIMISWCFCGVLTATNVFPPNSTNIGYEARTDIKLKVIDDAKWFRFPYPGQWGFPTASLAAVIGLMVGSIPGMIESVGDYHATAMLADAPPPPIHAINRGILFEGFGIVVSAVWGAISGVTSYSQNVGAIGITKVASRRVVQVGAIIMIVLAMFGKFGALFVTLPEPILGGIFIVLFGMITAVGVSSLQFVDLNSSRNLFVYGVSVFLGLTLSVWIDGNGNLIKTGNETGDQVLAVLLGTPMLIGGGTGFILDNLLPGTKEERGLAAWRHLDDSAGSGDVSSSRVKSPYNLPFIMSYLRRTKWTRYVPICPTYKPPRCDCCMTCLPTRGTSGDKVTAEGHHEDNICVKSQVHDNPVLEKDVTMKTSL